MPTFTAIALDRLLEPGSRNPNPNPKPPPPPVKLEREALCPPVNPLEKKSIPPRPPRAASPILYATPDVTPLPPDSPSSFPPSPYIVNHKRRGPRLLKTYSQSAIGGSELNDVDWKDETMNVVIGDRNSKDGDSEEVANGSHASNLEMGVVESEELGKHVALEVERDSELEDFLDFQDSMSTASNTDVDESNGGERSWKPGTPMGEYYDAFEEISSDGTARSLSRNVEEDLREMRLNLLMEIERRKQAEEALENLQSQWQSLRYQLSRVELALPPLPTITEETGEQPSHNPAEELCRQVVIARFVAGSIGRACARAEVEMEVEPQIESKNFEIARLWDRLQYYEAANREMSQRNQEAVEMARQLRYKRKRRQKWIWGSVGLAVSLGAAAIAWSYIPASKPPPQEGETSASHGD